MAFKSRKEKHFGLGELGLVLNVRSLLVHVVFIALLEMLLR